MIPYFEKNLNGSNCIEIVEHLFDTLDSIKKYLTYTFYCSLALQLYRFDSLLLILSLFLYIALVSLEGYKTVKRQFYSSKLEMIKNKYASLQLSNNNVQSNSVVSDFKFQDRGQ
jgi:hypothetical protein